MCTFELGVNKRPSLPMFNGNAAGELRYVIELQMWENLKNQLEVESNWRKNERGKSFSLSNPTPFSLFYHEDNSEHDEPVRWPSKNLVISSDYCWT